MATEKLISEGSEGYDNNSIVIEGQDTNQGSFIQCGYGCGFADGDGRAADIEKRSSSTKRLWLAVVLCVLFMSVEVAGGLMANSLAILTDAAHLLLDVAGFAISLFAIWASGWEATPRQTYGFHRLEILGALMSIQLIWLLTGVVVYEAIYRLFHENKDVNGILMFTVAAFGFVVNLLMTFVLGHDHGHSHSHGHGHDHKHNHSHDHHHHHRGEKQEHSHGKHHKCDKDEHDQSDNEHQDGEPLLVDCEHEHLKNVVTKSTEESVIVVTEDIEIRSSKKHEMHKNINMEGAYLHVLGDLIQSIGVMIGGAIIWAKPEWKVVDLICTLLFSALVLVTTVKMLRSILEVLMESTPREIDATELENGLLSISGVLAVHELHIWAITVGKVLLACHVKIEQDGDADRILKEVILYCEKDYKISHVTVQIERDL